MSGETNYKLAFERPWICKIRFNEINYIKKRQKINASVYTSLQLMWFNNPLHANIQAPQRIRHLNGHWSCFLQWTHSKSERPPESPHNHRKIALKLFASAQAHFLPLSEFICHTRGRWGLCLKHRRTRPRDFNEMLRGLFCEASIDKCQMNDQSGG